MNLSELFFGLYERVDYLLDYIWKREGINERGSESLMYALKDNDFRLAYKLLKKGANPNVRMWGDSLHDGPKCSLEIAPSRSMKWLLRHFGAVSRPEAEKLWVEERRKRMEEYIRSGEAARQEQERKRSAKRDPIFPFLVN